MKGSTTNNVCLVVLIHATPNKLYKLVKGSDKAKAFLVLTNVKRKNVIHRGYLYRWMVTYLLWTNSQMTMIMSNIWYSFVIF